MNGKTLGILGLMLTLGSVADAQPCPFAWEPVQRLSETPRSNFTSKVTVVRDTIHTIYYGGTFDQRLYYRRSTNRGETWGIQRIIVDSVHPQIWNRPLAASGSNLFVVWEHAIAGGIRLTRSTDGGDTWLDPQVLFTNTSNTSFGSQTVAASGSYAYVVANRSQSAGPTHIFFMRSNDGGATWDTARQITSGPSSRGASDIWAQGAFVHVALMADIQPSRNETGYIGSADNGDTWSSVTVLSTIDSFAAWEPSVASASSNNIYVCWHDAKYGSIGGFSGTVLMRRSTDNGATWLPEQRISALPSAGDATLTASSNNVYAAWADSRVGNLSPRVYSTGSSDYGMRWCDEELVGNPSIESAGPSLASLNGHVHLSLSVELDSLVPKIGYTRRKIATGIQQREETQLPKRARLLPPYPNPFNNETTISFELPRRSGVRISVYDLLGRQVSVVADGQFEAGVNRTSYSAVNVASGVYFVGLLVEGRKELKPIILLK